MLKALLGLWHRVAMAAAFCCAMSKKRLGMWRRCAMALASMALARCGVCYAMSKAFPEAWHRLV